MSVIEQDYGCVTTSNNTKTVVGNYWEHATPNILYEPIQIPTPLYQNKKGDDNMRYLYYVILVDPKTDEFFTTKVVARSETSALMAAYRTSQFIEPSISVEFDELKTNCKVLMEWKKEKSLEKALETIKKAVE